ncbi:CPBP family intramembrane metalloprotease [Staphylococcus pasteuri]|uniref:CPBP family intramembrane glutamic endopeptidase n=1 Tax=Staphylococcus pasteuri TaxID=45972 RepID=UPI000D3367DE|nr:type II CAAX endopeptidase family protein [Staphylococcus pasteuri]PTU87928.1 CPBP family intramembrane metalloprotease [Staphylococcus pasteuri]
MEENRFDNDNVDVNRNQFNQEQSNDIKPKGNLALNILIFIGWMILAQLPVIAIITLVSLSVKAEVLSITIGTIIYLFVIAIVIWLIRRYYLNHTYENTKGFSLKDLGIAIGWAIILRLVVYGFTYLLKLTTGSMQTDNDKLLFGDVNAQAQDASQLGQVFPVIIFVITLTFLVPYLEELIYRGIFKETLFRKSVFWLPFILSSIVFASQHGINNIIAFLMYMIMGMIFYLAYSRRGNIKDSMTVHMIHNGLIGVMILINYFYILFK